MADFRYVYFDLDDTLLDHRGAQRAALRELVEDHHDIFGGQPYSVVRDRYHDINVRLWRDYSAGNVDKETVKRTRFPRLLEALGLRGADGENLSALYFERYQRHWSLLEDAVAAYETIAQVMPVGIITNGFAEIQRAKLNRFPSLRDRAAHTIISEEIGYMKPHPDLFRHAEQATGVNGSSILYVGDSFESDILGATAVGWSAAWVQLNTAQGEAAVGQVAVGEVAEVEADAADKNDTARLEDSNGLSYYAFTVWSDLLMHALGHEHV